MQRVTSDFMQDLYEEQEDVRWSGDDLLVIRRLGEASSAVFGSGEPFLLDRLHIGVVVSGEQDVVVNLRQRHLARGLVMVASPESIMQEKGRTGDFDMQVVHIGDDLLRSLYGEKVATLFAHRMNDLTLHLDEGALSLLLTMLDALWLAVHGDREATRDDLLKAILNLLAGCARREEQDSETRQPRTVAVFNRFLSLVAEHCDSERTLDFYADKLCLSKQYLGSIICEVSHRTAREWIDEAALARIKVMLRHTTASLGEISDRMAFPEPSHFSRYFKRLTGLTPNQYRNR